MNLKYPPATYVWMVIPYNCRCCAFGGDAQLDLERDLREEDDTRVTCEMKFSVLRSVLYLENGYTKMGSKAIFVALAFGAFYACSRYVPKHHLL